MPPEKYFLSDRVIVMMLSASIWTGNDPNRDDRSKQAKMNLIICYKCDQSVHLLETAIHVLVFYTNDLISDLSGHHPALDCVLHSDLTYTNAQRDILAWRGI